MAFRNIFKREKKEPPSDIKPVEDKKEKEVEKKEVEKKVEKKQTVKTTKTGDAFKVLESAHITEKATDLTKYNQYVFRVYPKVNKKQIQEAVEKLYKVNVLTVRIISVPRKKRRLGRIEGWKKGYKKAIVKLKEGQKIEIVPR
jgi:large subunit ribosomal protein L23